MWVGFRHSVREAQFKVLAAKRVFSVVLNQGVHAGKVQVWRQEVESVCPLWTWANATVLDPPTAPEIRAEVYASCVKGKYSCLKYITQFVWFKSNKNLDMGTRRRGWSLWHKYHWLGPGRCHLFPRSLHSNHGSVARPSACPPSCNRETTALKCAGPGTVKDKNNTYTFVLWQHNQGVRSWINGLMIFKTQF